MQHDANLPDYANYNKTWLTKKKIEFFINLCDA